jgi:hypothetical protein
MDFQAAAASTRCEPGRFALRPRQMMHLPLITRSEIGTLHKIQIEPTTRPSCLSQPKFVEKVIATGFPFDIFRVRF